MSCYCINPCDTNKTLEATFNFIYNNQDLPNGEYYSTNIYLGIALTDDLSYENYNNRKEVSNIIYGKIVEVKETYCKIQTNSLCGSEMQIFTVAYSNILNIISSVFYYYNDRYINYMNHLPKLCIDYGNRCYNLLRRFKEELSKLNPKESLYLIYGKSFSLQYTREDIKILSNLVYLNNGGIVPVTALSGFFTVEEEILKENKLENMGKENDRGCN